MQEHDDRRNRDPDEEEIPSGLAQEGWEAPPMGGEENDPEGEGETPRGEEAMPGIPTDGEPDSSA
ncbi:MAG: hypothetical protein MSC31_02105 [Solirubrobacteraceae bacterium MAG38_C4-C5]|nr:hypothetical protein [Candidatus Siliceabacter maunaloa]